jgi:hypothetical protein
MFKLPEFPAIDFSKLDLDALRKLDLSKYVPAVSFPEVNFPKVDLRNIDLPTIDASKLADAVRDAAYLTVGVGIAAVEQAREITADARSRVIGLIRNAA